MLDHGLHPTHLDSHRHPHGFTPIFRRVVELARRYNVRFIRRHNERLQGGGWPASSLRERWTSRGLNLFGAINRRTAGELWPTNGTWGVAHTGRISAQWLILAAERLGPGVTEIVVHPGCHDEQARDRLAPSCATGDNQGAASDDQSRDRKGAEPAAEHPLPHGRGSDQPYSRLAASREQELAALCDPRVREAFERNGVRLIHYGQL